MLSAGSFQHARQGTTRAPTAICTPISRVRNVAEARLVRAILREVDVPSVKADEMLQEYFNAPADKMAMNKELENKGRQLAKAMYELSEAEEALKKVEEQRGQEPPRWQANYDYILARVKTQLAYLNEYSALLGQMRKDQQPPLDPKVHTGWRVASQPTVNDSTAKKFANDAKKLFEQLIKEHPDTPWEVLAKRDKMTHLGLEWQPTK